MKLRYSLLAIATLATLSPIVMAQSTADVSVVGSVVPGACALSLSNGGDVDMGQIDVASLNQVAPTPLPQKNVTVDIVCAAATRFATQATENKVGTQVEAGDSFFGLGLTSAGNAIGSYELVMSNPTADSAPANAIGSADLINWTVPAAGVKVEHGAGQRFTGVRTGATGGPSSMTTASWTLLVDASIAPSDTLALTKQESIDGSMTLDVVYL